MLREGKRVKKWASLFAVSLLMLVGCSREEPAAGSVKTEPSSLASIAEEVSQGSEPEKPPESGIVELTPPPGEPPEDVLRKLEFQRYAMLEAAGGLPVTVTATGRQLVLKPRLYSVRKESCQPSPQTPAGRYECSLTISVSLAEDGSDPSEQGERISVKWDGRKKEWVLQ